MSGCPISSPSLPAGLAVTAAPMSAHCLSRHAWAQTPRFLLNLSGAGETYVLGQVVPTDLTSPSTESPASPRRGFRFFLLAANEKPGNRPGPIAGKYSSDETQGLKLTQISLSIREITVRPGWIAAQQDP